MASTSTSSRKLPDPRRSLTTAREPKTTKEKWNEEECQSCSDFVSWNIGGIICFRAVPEVEPGETPSLVGGGYAPGSTASGTGRRVLVHTEWRTRAAGAAS